ncbi:Methyltransferase domain-containing protein [Lentzea waywayandensis]|uniref:Methyltransferase domain-containing protein n=1 Tax=Lentzea waywayandensis TaxID=84724 RepID=A0A1I6FGP0_9PSEU|nr:Methyltransferase domain-containing protein [Lentzea waywayandensis]
MVGVDPVNGMLTMAKALVPTAVLHRSTAERLPVDTGAIDLVLSTTSFGHWSDQAAGLAEVARVLGDGGRCHIAELKPARLFRRMFFRLPEFRTPEQMRLLVEGAGLVCDEATTFGNNIVLTVATTRTVRRI